MTKGLGKDTLAIDKEEHGLSETVVVGLCDQTIGNAGLRPL
jgi:hypothetical protein